MDKNVSDVVKKQCQLYSKSYLIHELALFSWVANFFILCALGYLYSINEARFAEMVITSIVLFLILFVLFKKISGRYISAFFQEIKKRNDQHNVKSFFIHHLDNTCINMHILHHFTYYVFVYLVIKQDDMPFVTLSFLSLVVFFALAYRLYQIHWLKIILLYLGSKEHIKEEEEYYDNIKSEEEREDYIKQASVDERREVCPRYGPFKPANYEIFTAFKKFREY